MNSFFQISRVLVATLLVFAVSPVFLSAQKYVKTTPQNRTVVLEEFTGINCTWCPDGHKRANDLAKANPGKVFLVNIHSGSFATPGANQPDYRTQVGTAIDQAAGVTGYPAGSVNRAKSPWAEGRGTWAQTAAQIMAQQSPVNVAVKSVVDFDTRKLTTEVEVFYTADVSVDNYITIFLTQSNILGPQIDGSNANPTNWVNGLYRHNHMLRMAITGGGAWGEKIPETKSGTLFTKTFVTDLPANITGIPVEMHNLEVVAFVSETRNNIWAGHGAKVEFDPSKFVDLGMTNMTTLPNTYKLTSINPKIEVTNNSGFAISQFQVKAVVNGVENAKTVTQSLAAGAKTVVDFGDISFVPNGVNTLAIQGFTSINGSPNTADMDVSNNGVTINFIAFKEKAFTSYKAGFETNLTNTVLDIAQNSAVQVVPGNASNRYGANNTTGATLFYLHSSWNIANKTAWYMFGEADFTSSSSTKLSYYYAYSDGQQGGTAPTIKTQISDDWGASWKDVNSTTCQQTGNPSNPQNLYVPISTDYKLVEVDMSAYNGKSVLIRVGATPGSSGNALWFDELTVTTSAVAQGPKISVSTNTLAFGTVDTDKSKEMELTINNTGDEELTVLSINKIDAKNAFTIVSGGGSVKIIMPGQNSKIVVKFAPNAGGNFNGALEINTNATNGATTTVNLTGTGNPAGSVAYGTTIDGSLSMSMTPNPVVDNSVFNYEVKADNSNVRIYVMDISGKVVSELVNSNLSTGSYSLNFSSTNYANGTYFVMAEINGLQAQIPVVIAK